MLCLLKASARIENPPPLAHRRRFEPDQLTEIVERARRFTADGIAQPLDLCERLFELFPLPAREDALVFAGPWSFPLLFTQLDVGPGSRWTAPARPLGSGSNPALDVIVVPGLVARLIAIDRFLVAFGPGAVYRDLPLA